MNSETMTANPIPLALGELARNINDAHAHFNDHLRTGLEHARRAGELLAQAKQQVGHGNWLDWLAANLTCSVRTAQAYSRVYQRWDELANTQPVAYLGLRRALELLADERADEPAEERLAPVVPRLPEPLATLGRAGVIDDECLEILLTIRDDYGADYLFPTKAPSGTSSHALDCDEAWSFMNTLRPLDQPTLWPWPSLDPALDPAVREAIRAAVQVLFDALHGDDEVPHWEVVALWYACAAALWYSLLPKGHCTMPDLLRHHIGVWRESFGTALAWCATNGHGRYPAVPPKEDTDGRKLWFGYRSDLRHAGLIDIQAFRAHPSRFPAFFGLCLRSLGDVDGDDTYPLPSSMQERLSGLASATE